MSFRAINLSYTGRHCWPGTRKIVHLWEVKTVRFVCSWTMTKCLVIKEVFISGRSTVLCLIAELLRTVFSTVFSIQIDHDSFKTPKNKIAMFSIVSKLDTIS